MKYSDTLNNQLKKLINKLSTRLLGLELKSDNRTNQKLRNLLLKNIVAYKQQWKHYVSAVKKYYKHKFNCQQN